MTTVKVDVPAVEVEITPELLAEAFWAMSDTNQAEFFAALSDIINKDCGDESKYRAEYQWMAMSGRLKEGNAHEFAKHFAECILYEEGT